MIGYNNLTHYDWSHYFEGGVCFHRQDNGHVSAYQMCHLIDYEHEAYDEDGELIDQDESFVDQEHSCLLVLVGTSAIVEPGKELAMSLRTLFQSPDWIVHRFQLGYVPIGDNELAFVGMEPTASRMTKSLNAQNLYTYGILSAQDEEGRQVIVSTLDKIQRGLTAGRSLRHDRWRDVWSGICKVLSYGKCPTFGRTSHLTATSTVARVRDMLCTQVADRIESIICPDFTTAIVAHRSATRVGYVVTNGSVVGTLTCATGRVVLHASNTQWKDKVTRKLAKEALIEKAKRLYADTVIFEV